MVDHGVVLADEVVAGLLHQVLVHRVGVAHLLHRQQVLLEHLPPLAQLGHGVADLVDDVGEHHDALLSRGVPMICTVTTTAISAVLVGTMSPYPTVRMVVVVK